MPKPLPPVTPQAFNVVFEKAILKTTPADEVKQRVINLTDEITYSVFMYTARGLFERDKLIFLAQVAFQVTSGLGALGPGHEEPPGARWGGAGDTLGVLEMQSLRLRLRPSGSKPPL